MDREMARAMTFAAGTSISKLGLRFDRVVLRVLRDLTEHCDRHAPEGTGVAVTISAPIHRPAATVETLMQRIDTLIEGRRPLPAIFEVCGNTVGLRLLPTLPSPEHKLFGLVHNPETSPELLLDMVETFITGPTSR